MNQQIFTLEEAAKFLGTTKENVIDLISCGDLVAVGTRKNIVRLCDLNKFLGVDPSTLQNWSPTVDNLDSQRSNVPHSIEIENILDEEGTKMKETEHKPYFDKQKGRWCIALSSGKNAEGRRVRKLIYGDTPEEVKAGAKLYLEEQKKDKDAVRFPLSKPVPEIEPVPTTCDLEKELLVAECYGDFLEGLKSTVVNRTFSSYLNASQYTMKKLGHLRMCDLNRKVIQNFLNELVDAKYKLGNETVATHYYSQTRINNIFDLLHRFIIEYSDEDGRKAILEKDFMSRMKKPRTKALKSERKKVFTSEEVQQILGILRQDIKIYCWVYILAETGCRPSEALALFIKDIDFTRKTIHISKALGKDTEYDIGTLKKTGKPVAYIKDLKNETGKNHGVDFQTRDIPVSDGLLEAVQMLLDSINADKELLQKRKVNGTEKMLFTGPKGDLRLYDDYAKVYKKLLKRNGLDPSEMRPYCFRHTLCTNLITSGVDLKTVQIFMGDNTPDMILNVYANVEKDSILASDVLRKRMVAIMGEEAMEEKEIVSGKQIGGKWVAN